MKPGDIIENAIWLTGEETPEQRRAYEQDVQTAISDLANDQGVVTGPVKWTEKRPGDARVPPVPDHVQGIDVRLLVAEAEVLCMAPTLVLPGSFVSNLDAVDLERLRALTRRAHAKANPKAPRLTDAQCDEIIEELGPDVALRQVRDAVNYGRLN